MTVDLVFSGRALTANPDETASGRRQLLILALFSAMVAHFLELHVGIAIVSTMTHFWIFAGVLVAIGMGWGARGRGRSPASTWGCASRRRGSVRPGLGCLTERPAQGRAEGRPQDAFGDGTTSRRSRAERMAVAPVARRPLLASLPTC